MTLTSNLGSRNASLVARESAANPRIMIYHATASLTDLVVAPAPPLVLAAPGVEGATVVRYRLRVRRFSEATWEAILPCLDAAVLEALGARALVACPSAEGDYRAFLLAKASPAVADVSPAQAIPKRVHEGVRSADQDPVAARLFALDGVAETIFERGGASVTVRKGRLFSWEDGLAAAVVRALAGGPG